MASFRYFAFWGRYAQQKIQIDHFNKNDHIFRIIEKTSNFYEQDLLYFLASRLKQGGTYIDIGANIGNHAVFFGKFLADYTICVEPYPIHVDYLKKNLQQNGITEFKIIQAGVYSEKSSGYFIHTEDTLNNSGMTAIEVLTDSEKNPDIDLITLDEITSNLNDTDKDVILIKIDVEGLDYHVLLGGLETLRRYHPVVVFEAGSDEEHQLVHQLLDKEGYVFVEKFYQPATYIYQSAKHPKLKPSNLKMRIDNDLRRIHRRYVLWKQK